MKTDINRELFISSTSVLKSLDDCDCLISRLVCDEKEISTYAMERLRSVIQCLRSSIVSRSIPTVIVTTSF